MLCGLLAGMVCDLLVSREDPDIALLPAHLAMGGVAVPIAPAAPTLGSKEQDNPKLL